MKKIKKVIPIVRSVIIVLSVTLSVLLIPSCKDEHVHTWEYYSVKPADCTNKGLLEKLCKECGEKQYEDLQPSGHVYQDGYCKICGIAGNIQTSLNRVEMPANANNVAKWSLTKIYKTAGDLGYRSGLESFVQEIGNKTCLDKIYLDSLGLLHFESTSRVYNIYTEKLEDYLVPLSIVAGKVSPESAQTENRDVIKMIEIKESVVTLTYSDGTQILAGTLSVSESTSIDGFGINPKNELVVYYADGTIAFAGALTQGEPPENQSILAYREVAGGYAVSGILDHEATFVKIPLTHRGKPISGIDNFAFENNTNIKTLIIGANVSQLGYSCFQGLDDCTFYFEAPASQYVSNSFLAQRTCYFQGEWTYANGVPTPLN